MSDTDGGNQRTEPSIGEGVKAESPPTPEAPLPIAPKVDLTADLPEEVIRSRLRLVNPELVKDIFDLAKAQVQSEAARHIMLNTKAASVVTGAGVSLTLSFSIAGPLLSSKAVLPPMLIVGFLLAGLAGLLSMLCGVVSLFVKGGFAHVSDHAVFDEKALEFADNPTGCDDLKDLKEKYAFGAAAYRQHMTAHLWAVSVKDHRQLDKKAGQVQTAQWLFAAFAILIFSCGIWLFGVISSENKHAREASAASAAAAEGEVRRQRVASAAATAQVAPNASQAAQASPNSAARPTANQGSGGRAHAAGGASTATGSAP